MPKVFLIRKESFSASHRLHSAQMSDSENQKLFGKCNSINGHGHNYKLEVTLYGEVDSRTGLLFNLTDLKQIIREVVLDRVDHKNLNLDIQEFANLNPTTENLVVVIWNWLAPSLPKGLLFEMKVFETDKNMAVYRGEEE